MKPPYYAVIFTNTQTSDLTGYAEMAETMEALAAKQPGYLGMDHARDGIGITISYWEDLNAILHWKSHLEHLKAQHLGRSTWYQSYTVRICKVEREYEFHREENMNG
ncbi:antibiotic biosynthesis monooxygenase [Altibacter sp.]|uniref:antibiotic biosynthesis monooxygenase family protein n=1 Tax=Altibacter sp. TaxID=2024823 RepID=UPI000C909E3D|nr:antibiotic biosynthesis monooxygenase [Altibacter sp.]MAP55758.1 antibiotic biosynthesis monooxygenase [Altibacter sp.]